MHENEFIKSLAISIGELADRCHDQISNDHSLRSRVLLQTSSEILGGLKKALEDSQHYNAALMDDEDDESIVSPKSTEPWD